MRLHTWFTIVFATLACGRAARAQHSSAAPDTSSRGRAVSVHAAAPSQSVPWFTSRDAKAAAAGILATLAIAPLDKPISSEFAEPERRGNASLRHTTRKIAFFGGSGPFLLSGIVYAATAESPLQGVARTALHNMEAIALASSITGLAKGIAGRALPDVDARHAFSFGRGFHKGNGPFVAFPSGHTAAAFAMAATLGPELGRAYPRFGRIAEPLAFGGAAAVAVARVIQRVHWPSDLPMAMVIGTWSGQAVQAHVYKKGPIAAAIRGLLVVPAAHGGTMVGWSSRLSESLPH